VADAFEASELLDVDVDHLAEVLAFVASDRFGRFEVAQAAQAGAFENAAHCRRANARDLGDMLSGEALAAPRDDIVDHRSRRGFAQPMRARRAVTFLGPVRMDNLLQAHI